MQQVQFSLEKRKKRLIVQTCDKSEAAQFILYLHKTNVLKQYLTTRGLTITE